MSRELVKQVLAELAATHDGVAEKLAALADADLEAKVTLGGREMTVRSLLHLLGNHDRDHTNQVAKSLQWMGHHLSEAQMIVAKAQQARGELIGLLSTIDDESLDRVPNEGEWTIRQTLQHILDAEKRFYANVEKALQDK